jgi:hypothetical protein
MRRRQMDEQRIYHLEDGSVWIEGASEQAPVRNLAEGRNRRPSLASLLTEAGIASEAAIGEALQEGTLRGEKLGEVVVRRGWATEDQLAELLARQWQLPFVPEQAVSVDPVAVARLPVADAHEFSALPLWFENQALVVAVAEPNEQRFVAIREMLGEVSFVVVPASTLERLMTIAAPDTRRGPIDPLAPWIPAAPGAREADPATGEVIEVSNLTENVVAEDLNATVGLDNAVNSRESTSERLRSILDEVQELEQALRDAQLAAAVQQTELDAARAARRRDAESIRELEARLAEQTDLLRSVKNTVEHLRDTL